MSYYFYPSSNQTKASYILYSLINTNIPNTNRTKFHLTTHNININNLNKRRYHATKRMQLNGKNKARHYGIQVNKKTGKTISEDSPYGNHRMSNFNNKLKVMYNAFIASKKKIYPTKQDARNAVYKVMLSMAPPSVRRKA